jgi:TRAP-type C4-dicarboxylate transport system substrate-binding protein
MTARQQELLDEATEIIRKHAETFRDYERQHWEKGTPEASAKAIRNRNLAEGAEGFLTRVSAK